jgi:hypothetical protein
MGTIDPMKGIDTTGAPAMECRFVGSIDTVDMPWTSRRADALIPRAVTGDETGGIDGDVEPSLECRRTGS